MKKFKQWLESLNLLVYWHPDRNEWDNTSFSSHALNPIQAMIGGDRIHIDHASAIHPQIKTALTHLEKQYPTVVSYKLDFDGHSPGTISDFLKSTNDPFDIPAILYHGTSSDAWQLIQREGLHPRLNTKVKAAYGARFSPDLASNENLIYLATSFGNAVKFAARDAANNTRSTPLVLKIDSKGLSLKRLRPDEDSEARDWQGSMHLIGSFGYEGTIDPQYISIFKMLENGEWISGSTHL